MLNFLIVVSKMNWSEKQLKGMTSYVVKKMGEVEGEKMYIMKW